MSAAHRDSRQPAFDDDATPWLLLLLIAGLWVAAGSSAWALAPADKPAAAPQNDGLFISVPNPLTSEAYNRIRAKTAGFLEHHNRRGVTLVYDFNPEGRPGSTADYGPCRDLAEFLLDNQDVSTVAFVHNDVTGHTVLPVLACKEIVMSSGARLGDALKGQNRPLRKDKLGFYEEVAGARGRCPAIVLKMVDKDVEVIAGVRVGGAAWYVDRRRLPLEKGFAPTGIDAPPVFPAGSTALYSQPQAQKYGLCSNLVAESRQEVAQAYGLPVKSLHEDPLEGRTPVAWRIEVNGKFTGGLRETIERRVRRAVSSGANLLILQLECGDGDYQIASELGEFLRTLMDDKNHFPVMTVAYVTERARDNAAFLAFGCTEIVMDHHATLGNFGPVVQQRPQYQAAILTQLEDLLRKQGYDPLLAQGMLKPEIVLHRVHSQRGQMERRLMDEVELRKDKAGPKRWADDGVIKPAREYLTLKARLAEELGIARQVVEGPPAEAIKVIGNHYGADKVNSAGPDWLDRLAEFLRHPLVSVLLVMVGVAGLILELKMPGVSLPGIVAALCFVLYFWAHSQLQGNLWMLAVLLFILGLLLIGVEVFLVPGFGVTGVSGIVLIVVSLALATLVKKPETTQEWLEFGSTISMLGISLLGAIVMALIAAWYLPHIPYVNRLILVPPEADAEVMELDAAGAGAVGYAALLGAIGEAATTLRPAGKARFGDAYVDVVAEGSYVPAGRRVQVIEIEGNRIVVKPV
jgi:membrane-bound ClpP family serine protease